VQDAWGAPVNPNKVEAALREHPDARLLAFVHAETSTGVRSDAQSLAALAARHGVLCVMDAVTSLGGMEVEIDLWGVDAVYSGSQKCLSCAPGLSPVSFSPRAAERIRARRTKVQSWFLDMNLIMDYWGSGTRRSYHHTAPVNALYGLHEALCILAEEGLGAAWERHRLHHEALVSGLEAMGLALHVAPDWRLPQLNAVMVPEGVDEAMIRASLLRDHGLEIGAGLGAMAGKIWRIGLMGHACNRRNVLLCLAALEDSLVSAGAAIQTGLALSAAHARYAQS
jgi:alanine-glyoxylate transaminase/serine-glyoxylate transaminase/serine-pyruvate transaminase